MGKSHRGNMSSHSGSSGGWGGGDGSVMPSGVGPEPKESSAYSRIVGSLKIARASSGASAMGSGSGGGYDNNGPGGDESGGGGGSSAGDYEAGGSHNTLAQLPHIVEGGHPSQAMLLQPPSLALHWEKMAREQEKRAQNSEDAHAYDTNLLFGFLKERRVSLKRSQSITDQMILYCSTMISERDAAQSQTQTMARKLSSATVDIKILKDLLKEADQYKEKYYSNKEKLDKADAKRNEAVARVMQQLSSATHKHAQDKHASELHLHKKITMLENELAVLGNKHEQEKKHIEDLHQDLLGAQAEKHKEVLQKQHAENERVIDEIIDSHDAELEVYNAKVRELASDLISHSDDFRPATDQALSMKLLDLRNRIKNITVPNNLQMRTTPAAAHSANADGSSGAPDGLDAVGTSAVFQLPADLDRTGFVAGHGSRDIQYVLRGLVWQVLIEGFFSSPFGFGFLGSDADPNSGRRQLLEIHRAWRRLYEGDQHPYRSDELSIYSHDPYANKMRSALFQSFLPAVYPDKASRNKNANSSQQDLHQGLYQQPSQQQPPPTVPEDHGGSHQGSSNSHDASPGPPARHSQVHAFRPGSSRAGSPPPPPPRRTMTSTSGSRSAGFDASVAVLYRQHCDSVVAKIRQLLDSITNNNTRPDVLEAVPTIVNLAAELGLECGVQRAQVWLLLPKRDEVVTIGAEYADCLGAGSGDGEGGGGRDVKVDLVVSPGIVRIGDGRRDMTVRKALVPCEVFPYLDGKK